VLLLIITTITNKPIPIYNLLFDAGWGVLDNYSLVDIL
jgi:hypothetical protein